MGIECRLKKEPVEGLLEFRLIRNIQLPLMATLMATLMPKLFNKLRIGIKNRQSRRDLGLFLVYLLTHQSTTT